MAQIDAPSDKILILEKGQAAPSYEEPLFDPAEWNWTTGVGPVVNGTPTNPSCHAELRFDVDAGGDAQWKTYNTSPADMPRFRHHGGCSSLFVDGHVESIRRRRMDWYKNIYIPGLYADLEGSDVY